MRKWFKKARENKRGSALVTVIAVIALATVLVSGFAALASSSFNRSIAERNRKQAEITAKAMAEMIIADVNNDSGTMAGIVNAIADGGTYSMTYDNAVVGDGDVSFERKGGKIELKVTNKVNGQLGVVRALVGRSITDTANEDIKKIFKSSAYMGQIPGAAMGKASGVNFGGGDYYVNVDDWFDNNTGGGATGDYLTFNGHQGNLIINSKGAALADGTKIHYSVDGNDQTMEDIDYTGRKKGGSIICYSSNNLDGKGEGGDLISKGCQTYNDTFVGGNFGFISGTITIGKEQSDPGDLVIMGNGGVNNAGGPIVIKKDTAEIGLKGTVYGGVYVGGNLNIQAGALNVYGDTYVCGDLYINTWSAAAQYLKGNVYVGGDLYFNGVKQESYSNAIKLNNGKEFKQGLTEKPKGESRSLETIVKDRISFIQNKYIISGTAPIWKTPTDVAILPTTQITAVEKDYKISGVTKNISVINASGTLTQNAVDKGIWTNNNKKYLMIDATEKDMHLRLGEDIQLDGISLQILGDYRVFVYGGEYNLTFNIQSYRDQAISAVTQNGLIYKNAGTALAPNYVADAKAKPNLYLISDAKLAQGLTSEKLKSNCSACGYQHLDYRNSFVRLNNNAYLSAFVYSPNRPMIISAAGKWGVGANTEFTKFRGSVCSSDISGAFDLTNGGHYTGDSEIINADGLGAFKSKCKMEYFEPPLDNIFTDEGGGELEGSGGGSATGSWAIEEFI